MVQQFEDAGLSFTGKDESGRRMEVYVSIGIGTCYVKVDDNAVPSFEGSSEVVLSFEASSEVVLSFEGSGVSQDGLVLMGKRFATSKYCYSDVMHAFPASFDFKGEALSSISDLSLLEIVTKTHGMPNGYRKVLKDSKCLYLGIDNCRKENLKNYLIPQAMLFSKVDWDSHKWIDVGN
ncbi:DNA mismatch repair protein MLH3-like isoform X1 [Solanum stenotomum]|uniref:DNA mismatch repair protein MLH3-like isoform X1 n=1 Tax=Solanum stenotomum TaxID=172797 RepID=UPI0020D0EC4B|nr:DNA mismatch repair protein MLH3-like isoform X1 [Solanum stenotomum]